MSIPMQDRLYTTILRIYPQAVAILDIQSYRPGYLPYPARITVQTTAGTPATCVLKVSSDPGIAAREAHSLRALAELQLRVPTVLAGPVALDDEDQASALLLLSELPGHPLPWIDLNDLADADRTCQLLQQAVDTLHSLTPL